MTGYLSARPGYEIRTLLASANILAHSGQQQACEDVLTSLRVVYKSYTAELHTNGMRQADEPGWAQRQITAALPVTRDGAAYRSDQLLDTDVRNARDQTLGSVHDIIMDPKTGKIAYLIIARGGIFGIGESFVPVPWADFKAPPNVGMLVLDATKASMEAGPRVTSTGFAKPGQFDQEGALTDAYWKNHLETKTAG
jgi:sporulation protein YlmC with PRC-barrel domain